MVRHHRTHLFPHRRRPGFTQMEPLVANGDDAWCHHSR